MTIYLSPGDCHRYYSPANVNVSERIYIPGFLEPVKPAYVLKHPKVFSMNERVTLRCKYKNQENKNNGNNEIKDDVLYVTFVGALNVGSINLSFDDYLKTNQKANLEDLRDESNYILKYCEILQKNFKNIKENEKLYYKPKVDEFEKSLLKEYEEFDVRDTIDLDMNIVEKYKINVDKIDGKIKDYVENAVLELTKRRPENLKYNIYNHFLSQDIISYKIRKNLKNPKKMKIEDYKVSDDGIEFAKKDELGWFNFGSTIVLVFSMDKNKEIMSKFKEGEQVKIGQSLFEIKH
jgi:phosphatidylserine decarboxylase